MEIRLTEKAQEQFLELPKELKQKARKQFSFLSDNFRHPSLNSKKYHDDTGELWQARIDKDWRFYFFIGLDYIIIAIIKHPK